MGRLAAVPAAILILDSSWMKPGLERRHFCPPCATFDTVADKNVRAPIQNETCLAKAGAMSERRNDLARGDIMECAGRALSGDGALAPGVANSVLIEAITCAGRSAKGFTACSP